MNIFNLNKKHFLSLGLLLACLIYFQMLHKQEKQNIISKISYFVIGEIQTTSVILKSEITSTVQKYFFLLGRQEENIQLKAKNSKLLSQQNLFKEIQQENMRLKKGLTFYQNSPYSLLPAKVVAKDFLNRNDLIVINRGSRHGIKKYMGVIHPTGVVGYVFRTTLNSAQVITLFSKFSSLPALNQRNRINGLIQPYKSKNLHFKYFNLKGPTKSATKNFQENDIIVTSTTRQFPSGLPIGYIQTLQQKAQSLTPTVIVKPYVSFSSLEEVFVLLTSDQKDYAN